MKAKTFPWLLMQNNTFLTNQRNKSFFLFECSQSKKKGKIPKNQKPRKTSRLITDRKESLQEITH
jgi:hypothetical protein